MQESWFLNFQVVLNRWKCDIFFFCLFFLFCWDIKWSSESVIEDLNLFMLLRALASGDAKKKKKLQFSIIKHYFIYFTNSFYNSLHILVFILTYNPIK